MAGQNAQLLLLPTVIEARFLSAELYMGVFGDKMDVGETLIGCVSLLVNGDCVAEELQSLTVTMLRADHARAR